MRWRWAAASEIGTGHIRAGGRLDDAYAVRIIDEDHIFSVVSDGAGSAKFGAHGAWVVCRRLSVFFREWFATNPDLPDDETIKGWVDEIRDQLSALADSRGCSPRQFAATLAAILISPDETIAIHIGDSAIVGRCGTEWRVVCWPENGEYAATTYFITDDPSPRLNIIREPRECDAFALFTDGVGDLALSHIEQQAHAKFFDPMIRPVDKSDEQGRLPDLSAKLRAFLGSETVCSRTDDDKTLVLLSGT